MSRRHLPARATEPVGPALTPASLVAARMSDSIVVEDMRFAGMVRTNNGYAVAVVKLDSNGKLLEFTIGQSQKLPQYVAPAAKQAQAALAQEVQTKRGGRLT